jgi:hypothetical protein
MTRYYNNCLRLIIICLSLTIIISSFSIAKVSGREGTYETSGQLDDHGDGSCPGHLVNHSCPPGEENNQPLGPCITWGPGAEFGQMHEGKTFRWKYSISYSTYPEDETIVDFSLSVQYSPIREKWLKITPKQGIFTKGDRTHMGDILVDTTGLSPGDYTALVHINSEAPSASELAGYPEVGKYIKYTLTVVKDDADDESTLQYSPLTLFYDKDNLEDGQKQIFKIWNSGGDVLDYTLFTAPYCPWISISKTKGSSHGEKDEIIVTVNPSKITCGKGIMAYIWISSNGGERGVNRRVDYGSKAGDAVGFILVRRVSKNTHSELDQIIDRNNSIIDEIDSNLTEDIKQYNNEEESEQQENAIDEVQDTDNNQTSSNEVSEVDNQQNQINILQEIIQNLISKLKEIFNLS